MKLSAQLKIDSASIRQRSFELNGQQFKVRVPLASEMDAIQKAVEAVDTAKHIADMVIPLIEKRETLEGDGFVFTDDGDVVIEGRSMRELAEQTARTEQRITEMVRLLVPVDPAFDMTQINYDDISEDFPFAIQLELVKKISEVVSPGYEEARKN